MIRSGIRQNRSLGSVRLDCYRRRFASAKAGEAGGFQGFPIGVAERANDLEQAG
jgi:hypothetical protein